MKIQAPPGMRDLYPEDMRLENWLFDKWRAASRAFGFAEYEGPIFEFVDLYTLKSGEAIVSELFHFKDRGERRFAIRPEMTPTLARMVAARASALPRPIKWFSIPRMCRAEKPQRGRLREFFQWNADILGVDDPLADAELLAVMAVFLESVGLTPRHAAIRVNSRTLMGAVLAACGIDPAAAGGAFELIDRLERLPPEEFDRRWSAAFGAVMPPAAIRDLLEQRSLDAFLERARSDAAGEAAAEQFEQFWQRLRALGIADYCEFDPHIVRGLAYYTGIVFEVHARKGDLRALAGGGRYDDLTGMLDGPRIPGVGFGCGDAPMLEALRDLDKLPVLADALDVFVIDADASLFDNVLDLAMLLRRAGLTVDCSYKRQALGKQLKQASAREARRAVIVGQEYTDRAAVVVKNLSDGSQTEVSVRALRADPRAALGLGGS